MKKLRKSNNGRGNSAEAESQTLLVLHIGMSGEDVGFLPCVRNGVRGYLARDASADDVRAVVRALRGRRRLSRDTVRADVPVRALG